MGFCSILTLKVSYSRESTRIDSCSSSKRSSDVESNWAA